MRALEIATLSVFIATLPVGSEFEAVGWGTEKPKGKGTLFLELEHVEFGARVSYGKDWVGKVEVLEQRAVIRDGQVLTTLEASVRRGPGNHRSNQSLTVPASLEPGVLELRALAGTGEVESSARTLFEVESP